MTGLRQKQAAIGSDELQARAEPDGGVTAGQAMSFQSGLSLSPSAGAIPGPASAPLQCQTEALQLDGGEQQPSSDARVDETRADGIWKLRLWGFGVNSAELQPAHLAAIGQVIADAQAEIDSGAIAWVCRRIVGHSSPEGEEDHNMKLAQSRADGVEAALGVVGNAGSRGEEDGAGAPPEWWAYYRAVEFEVEIICESDTEEVDALTEEIRRLAEEIRQLEDEAAAKRADGEGASDYACGGGQLASEDDTFWDAVFKILQNSSPGSPYGEYECFAGDEHRKRQERRAERLDEDAQELRDTRDELQRRLDEL